MTGPDAGLEALKAEVAPGHGLGAGAASFLTGETLDEVEASAAELARFVTGRRVELHPEPEPSRDPIAEALSAKAQRHERIVAMFTGRPQQPRDQAGRFTGFDGGARPTVARPADPEKGHAEVVLQLARARALGAGQ